MYTVSNCCGGTELVTGDREIAILTLLQMQFPGEITDEHGDTISAEGYELGEDDDGNPCLVRDWRNDPEEVAAARGDYLNDLAKDEALTGDRGDY